MANNVFQVKRTNVSGRTPNTTGSYGTNSQYIAAGEFALNMADGILYTSNGSAEITVGANLINQNITGNLTVKAIIANGSIGTAGQVLTTNSTGVYWSTVTGGGSNVSVTNATSYTFTANGSQNAFTLGTGVSFPNNALVTLDGLVQIPNTHYTISNTTLSFISNPISNTLIEVRNFEGVVTSGGGSGGVTTGKAIAMAIIFGG